MMSNFSSDEAERQSTAYVSVIIPIIYSVVYVIGMLGNGFVLYIMHKIKKRTITDIYVINLSIADFIFIALLPFWTVDLALGRRWIFGEALCRITSGSTYIHMYAGVLFLAALSVDRVHGIVYYSSMVKRSQQRAKIAVCVVWFASVLMSLLPFCFRGLEKIENENNDTANICTWTFEHHKAKEWSVIHIIIRNLLGFILPTIVIVICYVKIALYLSRRRRLEGHENGINAQKQRKASILVTVVVGVYLFCWLPNQTSNLVYSLQGLHLIRTPKEYSNLHYHIHLFTMTLAWSQSCLNPFLYAFIREDIVDMAKRILTRKQNLPDSVSVDIGKTANTQLTWNSPANACTKLSHEMETANSNTDADNEVLLIENAHEEKSPEVIAFQECLEVQLTHV